MARMNEVFFRLTSHASPSVDCLRSDRVESANSIRTPADLIVIHLACCAPNQLLFLIASRSNDAADGMKNFNFSEKRHHIA